MKFSLKVVIGTMFIVVFMFSLSGVILIHENFKNSYQLQMKTNYDEHSLEKYSIETNVSENILENGKIDLKKLESYLYTLTYYLVNSRKLAIYIDNESVWNNIPFLLNIDECENTCVKNVDSKKYNILKSDVTINDSNVSIISVYDISGVFEVRDQNLVKFYIIDVVLIILCGCLTTIFAKYLTKPLKTLNEATKIVSSGNLDKKTNIKGNDEIGELSKSFDLMIDSIKKRQDELALAVKQREDFISNFTHELKTPMTSIIGYTKVLKQDKYSNEDKEKALSYICSETKRLEVFSHKLLDLIGLSEKKIVKENLNTKELFKEIESLIINRFSDINLNLDIKEQIVIGDKNLLITCIINLIENAYKASEDTKKINVIGETFKNKYKISVIDEGVGIKREEIRRIAEDFYMVDKSRSKKKGSYGLGLGLCTKILKIHNTKLNFKSKVGKGTIVSFELEVFK